MRILRMQAYQRSVVLLLCFASGLEVPQLRALSIAVGDSIAQARALLQPSCCAPHSPS